MPNNTYAGNPFELEVDGAFTHTSTGKVIALPGYYDGSDTWKIGFMPTDVGEWTYVTSSVEAELSGVTGTITVVQSGLPGMLKADPSNPRKWKYTDGPYVIPLAPKVEIFGDYRTIWDFRRT